MRTAIIISCVIGTFLVLSGCCSKTICYTGGITYPEIMLYFPEAYQPLHTLTYVRLRRGTHQAVDTFSTTCGDKECPFNPWFHDAVGEWSDWDYALSLDEPTYSDTVYGISYNKVMNTVSCKDCIGPVSQTRNYDTGHYGNLRFFHRGKELHEGDSVFMMKR